MYVEHFEKYFRYTDRELLLVARKVGKLATYCKRVADEGSCIRVEAEKRETKKNQDRMKVMITIYLPLKTLRAVSRRNQIIDALDRCIEKLQPQMEKYKERHTAMEQRRKGGRKGAKRKARR